MLVLTRRPGEQIQIGNDIVVTVLGIKGNQVRLGFKAPTDTNIVRTELLDTSRQDVMTCTPSGKN